MDDFEDLLEATLKWTLLLWIFPYIFWYFGRLLMTSAWEWVTEPEEIA